MTAFEKYFSTAYDLVEIIQSDDKNFVAFVYDKNSKRLCVLKKRNLHCSEVYKILKSLQSPHIPEIYRLFERDGNLFVIEEHIDGETLENLFRYRAKIFDENFVENILLQICDCLQKIHEKNIVHRDITLSNIMLTKNNSVKLIDFGIARIFDKNKISDTEFLGTKGYAAPEQYGLFDLEQSDSRTDIYSLGIVMKNLLGENYHGYLQKILSKCTNLNPDLRYQNIAELLREINHAKKFLFAKKFIFLCTVTLSLAIFPNSADEILPVEEKIIEVVPQEKVEEVPKVEKPAPQSNLNSDLTDKLLKFKTEIPQSSTKEIPQKITPPAEKIFADKIKILFYLNGKLTENHGEHTTLGTIFIDDSYKNWQRKKNTFYFPKNWTARLKIENFTDKDLITPQIKISFNDVEIIFDKPTIKAGSTIDFDVPIADKPAFEVLGEDNIHGKISVAVKSPSGKYPILMRELEIK